MCLAIEDRYKLEFLEIGADEDHVHILVQSVPTYTVTKMVTVIKTIAAHEIFRLCPHVKSSFGAVSFGVTGILLQVLGVTVMKIQ